MPGINKVILVGNLGRDPEIRALHDMGSVATLSVATSDVWKDKKTGERREKTEWHRVVIFNSDLAKVAGDFLKKGSKVYIEGSLRTRKWTDQTGVEKYTTEVVLQPYNGVLEMLDGRRQSGDQGQAAPDTMTPAQAAAEGYSAPGNNTPSDLDDEIPF